MIKIYWYIVNYHIFRRQCHAESIRATVAVFEYKFDEYGFFQNDKKIWKLN